MAILWFSSRPIYGSNYKRSPSLLASLRMDGGYATSPSAPVNRLRRYSEYFGRTSPRLPSNRLQHMAVSRRGLASTPTVVTYAFTGVVCGPEIH